jgi:uncharacterized membrane protein required for colicin V production
VNAIDKLPVNWFDLVVVAVLVAGVLRGRKRGMSQELVNLIQWIAIIFGGALLYLPIGQMFAQLTSSGMLFSYIFVYVWIAVVMKLFFMMIKHSVGGKLVGSDMFGGAEYYLGMSAGLVRFVCVLLMSLALLNARYFSPAEISAYNKFQQDVYGSNYFPGLSALQQDVFEGSLSGSFVKKQLEFLLITPTPPSQTGFKQKEFAPP